MPRGPGDDGARRPELDAASDAEGRFELRAPAGIYDLVARRTGFVATRVRGIEIPAGDDVFALGTLRLEPGATIAGRVVDGAGEPLAAVEVRALDAAVDDAVTDAETAVVTGADGRFLLQGLPPGRPAALFLSRAGYHSLELPALRPPPASPLELVLVPGATLAGRVLDEDGTGVAGATLFLAAVVADDTDGGGRADDPIDGGGTAARHRPWRIAAGDDGGFVFSGLAPGRYRLRAHAAGLLPAAPVVVDLSAGDEPGPVELLLERGAELRGRVLDADGLPVAGAEAFFYPRRPPEEIPIPPPGTRADDDGEYRLAGLPPGPGLLRVSHPSYPPAGAEIRILPGGNLHDVRFAAGFAVSGRVVDGGGAGVAGARVALRAVDALGRDLHGTSGAGGVFRFAAVPAGDYRLEADARRGAAAPRLLRIHTAVSDLELELAAGAALAGRVLGLDFAELAEVELEALCCGHRVRAGRVRWDGGYRLEDLAPGTWLVEARLPASGRRTRGRITIEPWTDEARLDLEFAGEIALGVTLWRRGAPVAGAAVLLLDDAGTPRGHGRSDPAGRLQLDDLPAGGYRLEVRDPADGLVHQRRLRLEGDRELLLELGAARVAGRVVAADGVTADGVASSVTAGVAGAGVSLVPLSGTGEDGLTSRGVVASDEAGRFRFVGVAAGRYRLRVARGGHHPNEAVVEVAPAARIEDLEISLPPVDRPPPVSPAHVPAGRRAGERR